MLFMFLISTNLTTERKGEMALHQDSVVPHKIQLVYHSTAHPLQLREG